VTVKGWLQEANKLSQMSSASRVQKAVPLVIDGWKNNFPSDGFNFTIFFCFSLLTNG
jgi:hypothetical protein